MAQPKFSLNEFVVINDEAEVEDVLRGIKCQVRDFNRDEDEYQLYIVEGQYSGQYLWASAKYIWSWSQYRLMKTIDKNKYLQYIEQINHANKIRDAIFKNIYGITKENPEIQDFRKGLRVRVKRRAAYNHPWHLWSSEMDAVQGEYGKVAEIARRYNSISNEYEDVVKIEFVSHDLFSDYVYYYYFLPRHLEIQN